MVISTFRNWLGRRSNRFLIIAVPVFVVFLAAGRLSKGEQQDPVFRIEALIARGHFGEAMSVLNELDARKLDAWDARKVTLQRAVCQMRLGQSREALDIFIAIKSKSEEIDDYLAFWMGQCAEALGQSEKAEAYFARVHNLKPVSLLRDKAALKAAELAMAQGNYEAAIANYNALLGKSPREGDALAGLVVAWTEMGDSVAAREGCFQLIQDYPGHSAVREILAGLGDVDDIEELFYAGIAYRAAKKYRQAADLLRRVVKESHSKIWQGRAQYELGHVYYRSRKFRTAERAFERAFKVYEVPKALFEMGRCAIKRGHDLTATTRFREFVQHYPNLKGAAEALWQAGMAYERRGRHRDARTMFLALAKTYPKSSYADQAAWRAGFALYQTRQYTAAAKTFLRLARQTPENYLRDQGYYWAGKCYQKLGREEEAAFWIQRASEGFPTSYYSARAHAVLGRDKDIYPDTPQGEPLSIGRSYEPSDYLYKGDTLASIGLYRDAEREYDRARRVQGRNLFALDDLLQRYERVRAMHKALQVSGQMVMLGRQQGVPMTLSSFRRLYPTYYWGEINQTAEEMDLDPNLMIAIMRQESAFNKEAVSRVGARGLMQVMPETGKDMARLVKIKDFTTEDLNDPHTSILLGGKHLSDHMKSFRRDKGRQLGLALSAYNAGLTAARRWSRRLTRRDVDEFVESIPYKETRTYVKLVYRNYQVYSYLQSDDVHKVQEFVH
jgi:soluble lytic murein transglycosylase